MKYVSDLRLTSQKLGELIKKKGMIDKKGNPDKTAFYNMLHPDSPITEEFRHKYGSKKAYDATRSIDNFLKGNNYPNSIEDILDMCNALDCDLDYLFTGDLEVPTHDLKFVTEETGLSVDAVSYLKEAAPYEQLMLSIMLETGYFKEICLSIYSYMTMNYKEMSIEDSRHQKIQMDDMQKMAFARYQVTEYFLDIINKISNDKNIKALNLYEQNKGFVAKELENVRGSLPEKDFNVLSQLLNQVITPNIIKEKIIKRGEPEELIKKTYGEMCDDSSKEKR